MTPTLTKSLERPRAVHLCRRSGLAAGVVLLWFVGCDFPGKPKTADQPTPPEKTVEFGALYTQNCSGCHGSQGEFGPAPPLHNDLFRAIVSQRDLEQVISEGRRGTPMPAFALASGGTLSPAQIKVLVFEIKGVRYRIDNKSEPDAKKLEVVQDAKGTTPTWGVAQPAPANATSYSVAKTESERTSAAYEQIRKAVFVRACAGCHGNNGQGAEKAGAIHDPDLLNLASDQFLRRLVITGRPDLGMPDFAGAVGRAPDFQPLTSQEIADLVQLLGSWRQGRPTVSDIGKPEPAAASASHSPIQKADQDGKSS